MNDLTPFRLDRRALTRAFERASRQYDAAAALQDRVRAELLSRLQYFRLEPRVVVDLGTGTGQGAAALRRRFPHARVLAIDIAPAMLRVARRRIWPWRHFECLCADAVALPLQRGTVDLLYSSLMLQWCDRPGLVFAELQRVLRPGGLAVFSTFGPDTLQELRAAWGAADRAAHVSQFADLPGLGAAMMHAGLAEPVLDVERIALHYPDAYALMRALKSIGAHNAVADRPRGLTGRRRLQAMLDAYETLRVSGGLPATYEVIYGAAFAGQSRGAADAAGETRVPLAAVQRKRIYPDSLPHQ